MITHQNINVNKWDYNQISGNNARISANIRRQTAEKYLAKSLNFITLIKIFEYNVVEGEKGALF